MDIIGKWVTSQIKLIGQMVKIRNTSQDINAMFTAFCKAVYKGWKLRNKIG